MFSTKFLMLNADKWKQILKPSLLVYSYPSEGMCSFITTAEDRDTEKSYIWSVLMMS